MKNWRRSATDRGLVSCGVVPFSLLLTVDAGDLNFGWDAAEDPAGWLLELLHPVPPGTVIISTGLGGFERSILVPVPESGTYQWRVRDSESSEACWVYSNVVDAA